MKQQDIENISRNSAKLVDGLEPAIEDVCIYLWRKKIITGHMLDIITKDKASNRDKAIACLILIPTRGPEAYDCLYEAARESGLFAAADILRPDQAPHQPEELLPDRWPSSEALADIETNIRMITAADNNLCQLYKYHLVPGQSTTYPMKHPMRGRAMIINNEEFEHLPDREGSHKDKISLQRLFQTFGFDVFSRNDQTNVKMWEILQREAANPAHQDADCFILVILSHGAEGVVFGTDGRRGANGLPENCIKIKDIRNIFSRVSALHGKPKLFFIQAVLKDQCPAAEVATMNYSSRQHDSRSAAGHCAREDVDALGEQIHSAADVFIVQSTVADHISWRNTRHGTWFIQAVVYIFTHYGYKYDLNGLMSLVNRLVGKAEIPNGLNSKVCEWNSSLRKVFYFFPGLHMDQLVD